MSERDNYRLQALSYPCQTPDIPTIYRPSASILVLFQSWRDAFNIFMQRGAKQAALLLLLLLVLVLVLLL